MSEQKFLKINIIVKLKINVCLQRKSVTFILRTLTNGLKKYKRANPYPEVYLSVNLKEILNVIN